MALHKKRMPMERIPLFQLSLNHRLIILPKRLISVFVLLLGLICFLPFLVQIIDVFLFLALDAFHAIGFRIISFLLSSGFFLLIVSFK
jgi:hypothetical protein